MKELTKFFVTAGILCGLAIGAVTLFIEGMPSWKVAVLVVCFVLIVMGTMMLCLKFFIHTLDARLGPRTPAQVVDTPWQIDQPQPQPHALLPAPYTMQPAPRMTVPVQSFNGRSPGARAAEMVLSTPVETEDGKREEIECSVGVLRKAADILSEGAQPTRASFNAHNVMSSVEISGAVSFLRTHGWIAQGAKGTPARWADGLTAEHAEQLQEWLSQWGR